MTNSKISVLILTLDEEKNIGRCLESLSWCNDVVILDSFSSDRTTEIAESMGARVYQRKFDNYAGQRNYGLMDISYDNSWLLMVDADEITPEDLVEEMNREIAAVEPDVTIYRMRRKDFFLENWIKRSSGYPTWFGRLMKVGSVRVEREINEEYVTNGEVKQLQTHLNHFPFNKGFSWWLQRHNRYSTMEAQHKLSQGSESVSIRRLFDEDPVERRRTVKRLVYKMPMRPVLVFLALYFVRGGFLDGRAGLIFCLLKSVYEFMIDCKYMELRLREKGEGM